MKKRLVLLAVSLGLVAILVYFSGPMEVANTVLRANPYYLMAALGLWFLGSVVRTLRWRYLLKKVDITVPFPSLWKYYVAGLFVANLSPAKTGEPARAALLKQLEDKSFSKSMSTIIVEKSTDLVLMSIICLVGIYLIASPGGLLRWVYLAVMIYAALILSIMYVIFSGRKLEIILKKILGFLSFLPKVSVLNDRTEDFVEKLRSSMKLYRSKTTLAGAFLYTLAVTVISGALLWVSLLAVNVQTSLAVATVALVGTMLISFLTMLPGSLGSGEVILVAFLVAFVGASRGDLTSAVLLRRVLESFMYIFVGAGIVATMSEKVLEL